MDGFDFIIHAYTLEDALGDGVLHLLWPELTDKLSGGRPIVITTAIRESQSDDNLMDIWNEYVSWAKHVRDTLPEEDQMFTTVSNGTNVWVIEDGATVTILTPSDY